MADQDFAFRIGSTLVTSEPHKKTKFPPKQNKYLHLRQYDQPPSPAEWPALVTRPVPSGRNLYHTIDQLPKTKPAVSKPAHKSHTLTNYVPRNSAYTEPPSTSYGIRPNNEQYPYTSDIEERFETQNGAPEDRRDRFYPAPYVYNVSVPPEEQRHNNEHNAEQNAFRSDQRADVHADQDSFDDDREPVSSMYRGGHRISGPLAYSSDHDDQHGNMGESIHRQDPDQDSNKEEAISFPDDGDEDNEETPAAVTDEDSTNYRNGGIDNSESSPPSYKTNDSTVVPLIQGGMVDPGNGRSAHIIIASPNKENLGPIKKTMIGLVEQSLSQYAITISAKRIKYKLLKHEHEFYLGAKLVLLVANENRMTNKFISESEESQLGLAYQKAKSKGAEVFVVLLNCPGSLDEDEPYNHSLRNRFEEQPLLAKLCRQKCFISVPLPPPKSKKGEVQLNEVQENYIIDWVERNSTVSNRQSVLQQNDTEDKHNQVTEAIYSYHNPDAMNVKQEETKEDADEIQHEETPPADTNQDSKSVHSDTEDKHNQVTEPIYSYHNPDAMKVKQEETKEDADEIQNKGAPPADNNQDQDSISAHSVTEDKHNEVPPVPEAIYSYHNPDAMNVKQEETKEDTDGIQNEEASPAGTDQEQDAGVFQESAVDVAQQSDDDEDDDRASNESFPSPPSSPISHDEIWGINHLPIKPVTVVVAGNNKSFLAAAASRVEELVKQQLPLYKVNIISQKIVYRKLKQAKPFFNGANLVILVTTGSQRLLLISDKEESQMGLAYNKATKEGARVFLILAGHNDSEDLTPDLTYNPSLTRLFINQPEVGSLADDDRFISMGFTHQPEKMQMNEAQRKCIISAIQSSI